MTAAEVEALADLYESDETAWLEAMAELAAQRRAAEMDYEHLAEFLTDMARRDRREVRSRLVVLITHLLKWVAWNLPPLKRVCRSRLSHRHALTT
jgi:hypothetical protein